ncbi:MAG: immunoglobulin domain-containing protein [Phycisphaerales bacterium]|nr:immunoglobulin domain-containing protein [Phycisphaerales bacterium]
MLSIRLSSLMFVAAVVLALAPSAARAQCNFLTNPLSQAVCPGANVTFTASAFNISGSPTYTWFRGATAVGSGSTLTLTNVDAADAGSYTCRVSFGGPFPCTNTSSAASLTVRTLAGISSQPAGEGPCVGGSFTPSVTASGTGPFTYQWRRGTTNLANGGRISGATSPNLTISGVVAGDAAFNYNCVVTGPCNSVTSSNCILLVFSPHAISSQPASLSRCVGESASFTVGFTGSPSSFQWRRGTTNLTNGGNISGANLDVLTINPVTPGDDASNYNCVITGSCAATVTSNNVDLNVQSPAGFTAYSSSTGSGIVCQGSNINLQVLTTGTITGHQWRRGTTPLVNGGRISGANTATLTITNFQPGDAGNNFNCVLTSPCGGLTAPNVELINRVPVNIAVSPANVITCPGGPVGLTVSVTGTSPIFQWRRIGAPSPLADGPGISGATTNSLTLGGTGLVQGDYVCDVTNSCGTQTSTAATITVRSIAMTTPPAAGTTVIIPNGFVLTGTATTTPASAITYVWKRNDVGISSGGRFSISPDGRTLTVLSTIPDDLNAAFGLTATDICGNSVTNTVPVFAVTTTEAEPNNTKATANLRSLGAGNSISGTTTAATDANDYFRFILPQDSGISRWQLAVVSGNQLLRLRGLGQAAGVPQVATDTVFQSVSSSQPLVWYTSGAATPQLYVSVEAAPGTGPTPYVLQLTRTDVTPDVFPVVIPPGSVRFTTEGAVSTPDTEIWLYDAQFNAIEGAGNDGDPISSIFNVVLNRTLAAGDYYIAHARFNTSSSLPNPPDDFYRGNDLLEFPGVIACNTNTPPASLTFRAGPAAGTLTTFTPTVPAGAFSIAWTKVTIGNPRCNPADIAYDTGEPLPPIGPTGPSLVNNGVTEGDYNLFFANFFDANPVCDIAADAGEPLPPFGNGGIDPFVNNGVTEGDYNVFFSIFFSGCAF